MTVDEFLGWTEGREGRWELHDGALVEKTPETLLHAETQREAVAALKRAVRNIGAPCHVTSDRSVIRIAPDTAYEPDVLVYCGPRLPLEAVEIPSPVIVVEVLSEATVERDQEEKFAGYFLAPSVMHYLILDPERRAAIHHRRNGVGRIETSALTEGPLRLEPPGLAFFVEELFAPGEAGGGP